MAMHYTYIKAGGESACRGATDDTQIDLWRFRNVYDAWWLQATIEQAFGGTRT
jgi:hypothetical protein